MVVQVGLYTPLILIGPGTGLSTFLSFTQHIRSHLKKNPEDKECRETKRILYFGCRDEKKDFIYRFDIYYYYYLTVLFPNYETFCREEVETLKELGVLSTVYLAQSTQEGQPKYVQDSIRANAGEVR